MKIILIVLGVLVLLLLVLVMYYGAFTKVEITEQEAGGEYVVYEEMTGPYSNSNKVMDKVYNSLVADGIETTLGVGIYYDNPKEVEKEKLKSELGCILPEKHYDQLPNLNEKYQVKQLPVEQTVVASFPFKGFMSVMFGIMKVYPALEKYSNEKGYGRAPVMEIYDVPNKKIYYRQAIR